MSASSFVFLALELSQNTVRCKPTSRFCSSVRKCCHAGVAQALFRCTVMQTYWAMPYQIRPSLTAHFTDEFNWHNGFWDTFLRIISRRAPQLFIFRGNTPFVDSEREKMLNGNFRWSEIRNELKLFVAMDNIQHGRKATQVILLFHENACSPNNRWKVQLQINNRKAGIILRIVYLAAQLHSVYLVYAYWLILAAILTWPLYRTCNLWGWFTPWNVYHTRIGRPSFL